MINITKLIIKVPVRHSKSDNLFQHFWWLKIPARHMQMVAATFYSASYYEIDVFLKFSITLSRSGLITRFFYTRTARSIRIFLYWKLHLILSRCSTFLRTVLHQHSTDTPVVGTFAASCTSNISLHLHTLNVRTLHSGWAWNNT